MLIEIGHVEAIFRYVVKSMAGERLEAASPGWHGLDGDRRLVLRGMGDRPVLGGATKAFSDIGAAWTSNSPPFDLAYSNQFLAFGCERRSAGEAQGRMSAMEYVMKAALRRRLCRRVNMIARRNPVKAPSNPSVIERLLNVRRPWPVRRNPVYPIVTVHRIARTLMEVLPFR
jgi:hypothetical protein